MHNAITKLLTASVLLCASGAAFAHPGHDVSGFTAGLIHPFSGFDHLLAMVAVGLWAVQGGGRKIWLLPATFMTMLAVGAGLAMQWQSLSQVESGVTVSVLALGLLVALSLQLPATLSMAITALFGMLHGYAHGLELPLSADPVDYALGFLGATAALHLSGVTVGKHYAFLSRFLGIAVLASGAYLLANA